MSWFGNELLPVLDVVYHDHKIDITNKKKLIDHLKKKHHNEKTIINWAEEASDKDLKDALKYVKKMAFKKRINKIATEIIGGLK